MLTALLLLRQQTEAKVDAASFFPLSAGTTCTYEEKSGKETNTFVDTVLPQLSLGDGTEAVPVEEVPVGRPKGSITFYRAAGDGIYVVAFQKSKPLESPYPILRAGANRIDWEYLGETYSLGGPMPMKMVCRSQPGKARELFGKKRATLDVHLDVTMGAKGEPPILVRQDATYAEGIGLVELKEADQIYKAKSERTRKIVSFTPAGPSE